MHIYLCLYTSRARQPNSIQQPKLSISKKRTGWTVDSVIQQNCISNKSCAYYIYFWLARGTQNCNTQTMEKFADTDFRPRGMVFNSLVPFLQCMQGLFGIFIIALENSGRNYEIEIFIGINTFSGSDHSLLACKI